MSTFPALRGGAGPRSQDWIRVYATNDFTSGDEIYDVKAIAFTDHGLVSVPFSMVTLEQSIGPERQSVWKKNNGIPDVKDVIKIIEDSVIEILA